jgi:hypothetical protein
MFSLAVNNNINVPLSVISNNGPVYHIDSRTSTNDGIEAGGTAGVHEYTFVSNYNKADIFAGETPLTLVDNGNSALDNGVWKKSIAGNSWNAGVNSTESFDASGVFAITWEVEVSTGTVRQMGGISTNPNAGNSYTKSSHAIYQVNNYFYGYVYENGSSKKVVNQDMANRTVVPGDRFGISISGGSVSYFIMKGSVIYPMWESSTLATTTTAHFAMAFNRGVGSSGHSTIEKAWVHNASTIATRSVSIEGVANNIITPTDIATLKEVGMVIQAGSTYGDIYYIRDASSAYDNLGVPFDIDMTHNYTVTSNQDVKVITH